MSSCQGKVTIIGAGISGICAAIKLKEAGIPFQILEKSAEFGGTWLDNIYPGSGCGVPSFLYSFSFAPNYKWSRKWSKQQEILNYIRDIAARYKLYDHVQFGCDVQSAEFNDGKWKIQYVKDNQPQSIQSEGVICSVGQLNQPNTPNFKGQELYQGERFHSARWNTDFDPTGKTVAIIGNGASAIQIIPELVPKVKELIIFQRTPSYFESKNDYHYYSWVKLMFETVPLTAWIYRTWLYLSLEFNWLFLGQGRLNLWLSQLYQSKIRNQLDPSLRDYAVPKYRIGCKRILISNDYLRV